MGVAGGWVNASCELGGGASFLKGGVNGAGFARDPSPVRNERGVIPSNTGFRKGEGVNVVRRCSERGRGVLRPIGPGVRGGVAMAGVAVVVAFATKLPCWGIIEGVLGEHKDDDDPLEAG